MPALIVPISRASEEPFKLPDPGVVPYTRSAYTTTSRGRRSPDRCTADGRLGAQPRRGIPWASR